MTYTIDKQQQEDRQMLRTSSEPEFRTYLTIHDDRHLEYAIGRHNDLGAAELDAHVVHSYLLSDKVYTNDGWMLLSPAARRVLVANGGAGERPSAVHILNQAGKFLIHARLRDLAKLASRMAEVHIGDPDKTRGEGYSKAEEEEYFQKTFLPIVADSQYSGVLWPHKDLQKSLRAVIIRLFEATVESDGFSSEFSQDQLRRVGEDLWPHLRQALPEDRVRTEYEDLVRTFARDAGLSEAALRELMALANEAYHLNSALSLTQYEGDPTIVPSLHMPAAFYSLKPYEVEKTQEVDSYLEQTLIGLRIHDGLLPKRLGQLTPQDVEALLNDEVVKAKHAFLAVLWKWKNSNCAREDVMRAKDDYAMELCDALQQDLNKKREVLRKARDADWDTFRGNCGNYKFPFGYVAGAVDLAKPAFRGVYLACLDVIAAIRRDSALSAVEIAPQSTGLGRPVFSMLSTDWQKEMSRHFVDRPDAEGAHDYEEIILGS